MSANFYCWTPTLGLDPKARDFHDRIEALQEAEPSPASPKLLAFVAALLERYPDLDETDDTVWAAGSLGDEIIGDFINMAVVWPRAEEAEGFIRETAYQHGLHFYDPQSETFYPCPSAEAAGGTAQRRKGPPEGLPPITPARLGCTLALLVGAVAYWYGPIGEFFGFLWALANARGNW
jgi:hypothetical protein